MLTVKYNKFKVTLPISKNEVELRPFLITEQKVILQAIALEDASVITTALNDVVSACILNDIEIDTLPYADVEFLILKLRSISVNDVLPLTYECSNDFEGGKCGNEISFILPLDKVKVTESSKEDIEITDKISIGIKEVDYGLLSSLKKGDEYESKVIKNSIDVIYEGENIYSPSDFSDEEMDAFLNSLSISDYSKLKDACMNIRTVFYEREVKCTKCQHTEKLTFKGIQDFLI